MSGDTHDWMEFARADLAGAYVLFEAPVPFRLSAWHAQQAAEKAIKAVLVERAQFVPRTHDLLELAERVGTLAASFPPTQELVDLTFHAVQPRYPDDLVEVDEADARAAQTRTSVPFWAVERALR